MSRSLAWRVTRRVLGGAAAGLVLLAAVLTVEVLLAKRAERLDGYPSPALDGLVGGDRPGEPLRLTWIGDSTGTGVGASAPGRALPRLVAGGLERPVELTVLAVSGAKVADALEEQVPQVAATRPYWVVIGIGSNDVTGLTARGRFRGRFDALLEKVAEAGRPRIVVLGIGEFASTPLFAQPLRWLAGVRAHQLDRDVRAAAAAHGATYVDIRGETGPAFVAEPDRMHARDGFHPSDAGYALWAGAVLEAL